MRNKKQKKIRMPLTLLFSGVTFLILISVGIIVGTLIVILINTGIIDKLLNGFLNQTILVILILLIFFIIGAIITFFLGRLLTQPLNTIMSAMNELASGNYKARLFLRGLFGKYPTIKDFTKSFNKMAEELEHTEILSTDFVNNFSHEIKTPVASISGFAKLLQNPNLTNEQRTEYAQIIEEESLRLSQVATNTLTLAKIENQGILTNTIKYNLSEQIRSSFLLFEKKWEEKNLDFNLDFNEYYIKANEDMLKEVWLNLFDNAIKFSNQNGLINVTIDCTDNLITVKISNSGSYIPKNERSRIFGKFYQVDKSHSSKGNGIGLAIVKEIVELHNGSISANSEENITTFTVILPKGF